MALPAATYYVDLAKGNDTSPGTAAEQPFKSIQKAADTVAAGDTVIVGPGVYFEHVQLKKVGTAEMPITFRTDKVEKNRVIITGAQEDVRTKKAVWTLEDEALQMWSVPFTYATTRGLYDGVDLYPYRNLASLKKFYSSDTILGPKHGFVYDATAKKLYVRLHPDGKYGSTDPNQHLMCFSPRGASESSWAGTNVEGPSHYNFGVLTPQAPAYVVIDGFTFETPGIVGVYIDGHQVTVRNCWFFGTRAAVGGRKNTVHDPKGTGEKPPGFDYKQCSNEVTVEYCYWTQFPTFEDLRDSVMAGPSPEAKAILDKATKYVSEKAFYWHRKGAADGVFGITSPNGYETGITNFMGQNWIVRNNHLFSVWDGLSANAVNNCDGAQIYDNLFENVADNAIEVENHASNMKIWHNIIIDAYEPISWQPLGGTPWPGPIFFYQNLIYNTPEYAHLWDKWSPDRGWLKAGADKKNWAGYNAHMANNPKDSPAEAPDPGFLFYNNTIYFPGGNFLTTLGQDRPYKNFKFTNNIFVCDQLNGKTPGYAAPGMEFYNNIYAAPETGKKAAQAEHIAGKEGKVLDDWKAIGWQDPAKGEFQITTGSPAVGMGAEVPGMKEWSKDAGAFLPGAAWPKPVVGPQAFKEQGTFNK